MWMFVIAIGILLCYLVYVDIRKPKDYPKGPRWYPIIGNYTQVSKELEKQGYHHKVWMEFANEYGNMIGLKMGTMLLVVVNGVDLVREVLTRDEFSGRPDGFFFRLRTFGKQIGTWLFLHVEFCFIIVRKVDVIVKVVKLLGPCTFF